MKKILHLSEDDKFIKYAYSQFSSKSDSLNTFYVFLDHRELKLKHINFPCEKIEFKDIDKSKFKKDLLDYDLIVIHFLNINYYPIIKLKKRPPIVWIGWGGDYYYLVSNLEIYKPKTKSYFKSKYSHPLYSKLKDFYKYFQIQQKLKILNKIEYFAPVLEQDYHLISKNIPNFAPRFVDWNYGTLEEIIGEFSYQTTLSNKVLIGNSATKSNNHLDIFEFFTADNNTSHEFIVPLNYGDMNYANKVSNKAKNIFGEKVEIISEFLEYEAYLKKILQCNNIIMGHVRQQALGNILVGLYSGAKVFFFSDSIVFKFLKKNEIQVFDIKELENNLQLLDEKLSLEQIELQRIKLKSIWGEELIEKKTKGIINLI